MIKFANYKSGTQLDKSDLELSPAPTTEVSYFPKIDSQAVLIVYDVTDPLSFREIEQYWLQEVKANTDNDVLIAIVGNKADLTS